MTLNNHSCMTLEHNGLVCSSNLSKEYMVQLPEKELHIRDAGGNDLGYKGTYLVLMKILGRKVMHNLVVLDHVSYGFA